jgi:hypothetical protein
MALPVARPGGFQKLCLWLKAFEKRPLFNKFFGPALTTLLPGALTFLGAKPETYAWVQTLNAPDILKSPLTLAVCAMLIAFVFSSLLRVLWDWIGDFADSQRKFSREDLNFFLVAFSRIVNFKAARFRKALAGAKGSKKKSHADIFREITKPDEQMDALIVGLHSVMEHLYSGGSFRCALLELDEHEQPKKWKSSAGGVPRTPPSQLRDARSTAMRCVKTRSIVVIEDIKEELKKALSERQFIEGKQGSTATGSQVCFPVLEQNDEKVAYVISIAVKDPGIVLEAHADLLNWAIGHFSERIVLEHYLEKLRESSK